MFSPGYLFVKVCCLSLNTLNSHLNSYIPSSETRGKYICSVFFFPTGRATDLAALRKSLISDISRLSLHLTWLSLKYPLRGQLVWVVFFDLGLSRSDLDQNVYTETKDYLWEVSAFSQLNRNFPPSQGFKHKINFKADCKRKYSIACQTFCHEILCSSVLVNSVSMENK